jgi:hypothetical protein
VFASGADPYVGDIARRHADVLGALASDGYPYLPHPPFAILLTSSFAQLSFDVAARYWFAASIALCFVLGIVLARVSIRPDAVRAGPKPRDACVGFAALLMWPPVLYNLEKGQFTILLAVLVGIAWLLLERGDSAIGGASVGLAAALKLFPALLAIFLLFRRRRSAIWFVAVAVVATTLPCVWVGWQVLSEFLGQSTHNVTFWQTWPAVTYSFQGLTARMFVGSEWSRAVVHAPIAATVMAVLASAISLAIAYRATVRCVGGECDALLFTIWSILLVPLNPVAMGHNGVLLALPIVLLGKSLAQHSGVWPKVMWSVGCVLVSIPRQAIFAAAPMPVAPWRSFAIVGLPLWGTLLLFSSAIAVAHARTTALSKDRNRRELFVNV